MRPCRSWLGAAFLDVAHYSTAEFVARAVDPIAEATPGRPNDTLSGDFTLRGVMCSLSYPVLIASADGARMTGQALMNIDRTEFGSLYGSGQFFHFLD